MITLEQEKEAVRLLGKGRRLRRNANGQFVLNLSQIQDVDFSLLPVGMKMLMDTSKIRGRGPRDLIMLHLIEIVDGKRVRVVADHFRSTERWAHVMRWAKYSEAIEVLLRSTEAQIPGFKYEGLGEDKKKELHHFFSMDVPGGTALDILRCVRETLIPILQPLIDFRDKLDADVKKTFGV